MANKISAKDKKSPQKSDDKLIGEIRSLIEQTRLNVAQTVNSALVLMNWHIGKRINDEVLKNKRAEYGKEIVSSLSAQLFAEYGRGFGRRNLFNMMSFANEFPDFKIVQTLSAQLGWSHFVEVIQIKDQLKRDFYAEMCRIERWSVRTLRGKV